MPYLTDELITNAFYHAKIRSKEFDTLIGPDISTGIDQLNKILADKTLATSEIPYYNRVNFNAIAQVSEYFIPDLIDVSTLTFFINGPAGPNVVRYATQKQSRAQFFGSARAMNINSLPFDWHMERTFGGANIYLYFVPNEAYPIEIWGLFRLASVVLQQDISLTLDMFYIDFLEFQLAERLCNVYDFEVPSGVVKQLAKMHQVLNNQSAQLDTKVLKTTTLNNRHSGLTYADVNLGKGWRPQDER